MIICISYAQQMAAVEVHDLKPVITFRTCTFHKAPEGTQSHSFSIISILLHCIVLWFKTSYNLHKLHTFPWCSLKSEPPLLSENERFFFASRRFSRKRGFSHNSARIKFLSKNQFGQAKIQTADVRVAVRAPSLITTSKVGARQIWTCYIPHALWLFHRFNPLSKRWQKNNLKFIFVWP